MKKSLKGLNCRLGTAVGSNWKLENRSKETMQKEIQKGKTM